MHLNLIIIINILFVFNLIVCRDITTINKVETWPKFLWERKFFTQEELNENVPEAQKKELELRKVITTYNNVTLENKFKDGRLFELFGRGFVLLDGVLYNITSKTSSHLIESQYQFPRVYDHIDLVHSTVFDDKGFVIICYDYRTMAVYGLFDKTKNFFLLHTIDLKRQGKSAKFFVNSGNLYLTIATATPKLFVIANVYKWTGTHFDIELKGPLGGFGLDNIVTFQKNETTEVVIMSEFMSDIPNLKVRVLEFSNGTNQYGVYVRALGHTVRLASYVINNMRYLVLFQIKYISTFYYDGQQFHKIINTETVPNVSRIATSQLNNYTLLYVASLDKFYVFNPIDADNLRIIKTITFNETAKHIINMIVIQNGLNDHIFIGSINEHDHIVLTEIVITTVFFDESNPELTELIICMHEIKSTLGYKYTEISKKSKRNAKNDDIVTDSFVNTSNTSIDQINSTLMNFDEKVNRIRNNVNDMHERRKNTIFGNLNIKGNLVADELFSYNIQTKTLNNKKWDPNNWLSHSKPQHITGPYILNDVQVNKLIINRGKKNPFNDILYLYGKQSIYGNVTIRQTLKANELNISEINDIPFDNIYLKSKPLKVTGKKRFENLRTDNLTLKLLNGKSIANYPKTVQNIQNDQYYNFDVDFINDVNWNSFKDSAFQIGKTSVITGDLKIDSLTTENLDTNTLAGRNANDLFTTTTNQEITANLTFSNINAKNINCNKINGVDIEIDAVLNLKDKMNDIKGPVIVKNMGVYGNIHLRDLNADVDDTQIHSLQIYKNVKITGNLHINNLNTLSNASIVINNKIFNESTLEEYWLKNKQQIIPNHVEALSGIILPHLITTSINNFPLNQYMRNENQEKIPSNFYFENVHVRGNLTTDDNQNLQPDLRKLNNEAVRLNGSYVINGKKTYTGKLIVDNLNATSINDAKMKNLKTLIEENSMKDRYFKKLVINGNVSTYEAIIANVNNKNVNDMYSNTIFIDEQQNIDTLNMENVKVKELFLVRANGENFDEYIINLYDIFGEKALKRLVIKGDLNGTSIVGVEKINGIDMNLVLDFNPRRRSVIFTDKVTINNMETLNINNVNFIEVFDNLFYKNWMQNVTGKHKFKKLYASNIQVPQINELKLGKLININDPHKQEIITDNVKLLNTKFRKSVNSDNTKCDINKAMYKLKHPDIKKIKYMNITKNVRLWDESIGLYQLVNNAYNLKKHNIITGSVTFKNLYGRNIITKNNIKNIIINDIVNDALYKNNREDQVVNGYKEFSILKTLNAYTEENVLIPSVNRIRIQKLNESIIFKEDINNIVVKGTKTFIEGFETTNLHTSHISGIKSDDLVSLDNLKTIPKVTFNKLKVDNKLDVDYVNEHDFNVFLKNRILKLSENVQQLYGIYYFNNLQLNGIVNISTINNIKFDDIVFDSDSQKIKAYKEFVDDVDVETNVHVKELNRNDISKIYENVVMFNKNSYFNNNIEFDDSVTLEGDIVTKRINGIKIEDIKKLLNNTNFDEKEKITQNRIKNIAELVTKNNLIIHNLPQKLLYIDYLNNYNLSFKNVINAQTTRTDNELMLHIIDEEDNEYCYLPSSCTCLIQHTLQITTDYSVNQFANKDRQRVYGYNDNERNVYIITNSISSNEFCRLHKSSNIKEETTIIYTNVNGSSAHEIITKNYVSDVKFFTFNNYTYAIISIYYDPNRNTHRTDSLFVRFSKELNSIEETKLIQTNGAWSLTILYTWQGINLVIGNNLNSTLYNTDSDVIVMRFNETERNFDILRKVPIIDHFTTTGISIGDDSFIIIADKYRNVHILKYDYVSFNYYMYQTITLDSSIRSLSSFNLDSRNGEPYLCIVTKTNKFYVYTYQYLEGWILISDGDIDGLLSLIPFELNDATYLFAPSKSRSNLLTIVKQG